MPITTTIARRYLHSNRKNRFFSWIATLSVVGIAIGIAAIIIVISLFSGFETELRDRFLAANSHVMIYRYPAGLEGPDKWMDVVQKDFPSDVKAISKFINYETMATKDGLMNSILVRGIVPSEREKVQSLKGLIRPVSALDELQKEIARGDNAPMPEIPSIILGVGLLSTLDAKVGEVIDVVAPNDTNTTEIGALQRFKIIGVYDSGLTHYDNRLGIMSLTTARQFFKMFDPKTGSPRVTGLEIGLNEPQKSRLIAKQMAEKYAISVTDWQSLNRSFFETMENEQKLIAIIVSLVAFVAGFNILTTLFISVTQKQKDISILKAIGATRKQILSIFLQQGMWIGIVGSVFGLGLAALISLVLQFLFQRKILQLPDLYLVNHLPMSYEPKVYLGICVVGLIISILAGLYPSYVASRVSTIKGLKAGLGGRT